MMRNSQWLPTAWILVLPWVQCPSPYDPPLLFPHGWHAGTPDQANEHHAQPIAICDVHSNQPLTTYSTLPTLTQQEPATLHTVSAHPGGSEDILHTFHGGGPLPGVAAYEPAGLATHGEFPTSFEASYLLDHLLVQPGQMISDSFEAAVPQYALWHNMQPHHYGDTVLQLAPNSPRMSHSRVVPPYPPYSWPTASTHIDSVVDSYLPEGSWSHSDPRIHETSHPENLIAPNPMATPARPHSMGQTNVALVPSQHTSYDHPLEEPWPSSALNPSSPMVPRDQPSHLSPGDEEPQPGSHLWPERAWMVYSNTEPAPNALTDWEPPNLPSNPHGKDTEATSARKRGKKRSSKASGKLKPNKRRKKINNRFSNLFSGESNKVASENIPSPEGEKNPYSPYVEKLKAEIVTFEEYLAEYSRAPVTEKSQMSFLYGCQRKLQQNMLRPKEGYDVSYWHFWADSVTLEAAQIMVEKSNLSSFEERINEIAKGIPYRRTSKDFPSSAAFVARVTEISTTFMTMVKALDYTAGEYLKYESNTHNDLDSMLIDFLKEFWKKFPSFIGQEPQEETVLSGSDGKEPQVLKYLHSYDRIRYILQLTVTCQHKITGVDGLISLWMETNWRIGSVSWLRLKTSEVFRVALWSYAKFLLEG